LTRHYRRTRHCGRNLASRPWARSAGIATGGSHGWPGIGALGKALLSGRAAAEFAGFDDDG
jgi:hypothetical protein